MEQIVGPARPEGDGWRKGSWRTARLKLWVRDDVGGGVEIFGEGYATAAFWRAEGVDGWPTSEDDAEPVQPPSAGGWAAGEVEPDPEAVGATATPQRYTATGRETIDRQRDMAHSLAEAMGAPGLGDVLFGYLCQAQVVRYMDRMGRKGSVAEDLAKAQWYEAMARHVMAGERDPRSSRPDFAPYVRHPWGGG